MSVKVWFGQATLAIVLLVGAVTAGWSGDQPLTFGVIIHRRPTLTAEFWNPILRHISQRSGVPLQLKVAKTGPEHTAMVRRGEVHFLYSNHNFIKENEASGYRVFARPKGEAGRGEIVVLKDSAIHSLADLKGKEVVFPHTAAFLGYHLPMDALMRQKVEVKPLFAGNQEGAMGQLKAGRAVQQSFLKMADDPEGAKVLEASSASAFVAARDHDFDNMRRFYRTTLVKVELQ